MVLKYINAVNAATNAVSKNFSVDNTKKTGFCGHAFDFS